MVLQAVRAIYEDGKLRLLEPVELKEGEEIVVQIPMSENHEPPKKRILGLHRGAMTMHDDFDDELPDSFWLGEDE